MLENLEGTPAEDLQLILSNLNPNADNEEQKFVQQLQSLRSSLESAVDRERALSQSLDANSVAPLRGLISEARKRGMTPADFADAAQLSTPLVMKLDLRLIRFASVPRQVIEDIASVIESSVEQVILYLQGAPIRTAVVYSEADTHEEKQEQQDFVEATRADDSLPAERRARLLGMM
ncbi:MAG: hypothetical protein M3441_23215 [Chloroflexota bacterium]|nr:hypothetical protein [Chloroflexota bacterium]